MCTTIATTRDYTVQKRDVGFRLLVLETAYNAGGASAPSSSVPTATVTQRSAPRPPGIRHAARVSGRVLVAYTLRAGLGVWRGHPTRYSYRWYACHRAGELCAPIPHASRRSYRVLRGLLGKRLVVWVTAYNRYGASAPGATAVRTPVRSR